MSQDKDSEENLPVPLSAAPAQPIVTIKELVNRVFEANEEDRLSTIQSILDELTTLSTGDNYAEHRIALETLGYFFQGNKTLGEGNFAVAAEKFLIAAENFEKLGQNKLRALALGRYASADMVNALRTQNIGLALKSSLEAKDYFQQAGGFAQEYQLEIDANKPAIFFLQAASALMNLDFTTAKSLIEQASQAAESFANIYCKQEVFGQSLWYGISKFYRAFYNFYRIKRDFEQFDYDKLALDIEINEDALKAKTFWSSIDISDSIFKQLYYMNEGVIELSDVYRQLSFIMKEVFHSLLKSHVSDYESLRQKIGKANAAFAQAGQDAITMVRVSDQLSSLINNLERNAPIATTKTSVVVLVHGIRTFANWQPKVREELEIAGMKVEPTNYEYLDVIQFLLPIKYFRRKAVGRVLNQIRTVFAGYRGSNISILAHSFGSYIVAEIIKTQPDVTVDRLVFCGSIVPAGDDTFSEAVRLKVGSFINDVGSKDIWPALAESFTTGYGRTGSYGFRRPGMRDRWHKGFKHSDFLTPEFCNKYWAPFFLDGTVVPSDTSTENPPLWLEFISIFKIKYLVPLTIMMILLWWKIDYVQSLLG